MSVLSSRFFMSLLACESSSTLDCSSALTVCSSSFRDCISSLEVVSSSLVDWSSSLVDWSSSLVEWSSSCELCISSRVVCNSARTRWISRSSSAGWASWAGADPARPGVFGAGRRRHLREDDHHGPPQGLRRLDRLDGEVHGVLSAVGCDPEALDGDLAPLPDRLLKGARQFVAQPFAGHGEDVPVGLARRRLEVLAGSPADVEDVALVVDQHGGRREALQEHMVGQRLEVDDGLGHARRFRHARQGGGKRGRELDLLRRQGGLPRAGRPWT